MPKPCPTREKLKSELIDRRSIGEDFAVGTGNGFLRCTISTHPVRRKPEATRKKTCNKLCGSSSRWREIRLESIGLRMPATDSTTILQGEPKRERSFLRCRASRTATNKARHSNVHSAKPPRWRKWQNRRALEPRSAALSTRYLYVTYGIRLELEFYRSRLRPLTLLVIFNLDERLP